MSESHKQTSKDLNSMLRELQTLQSDIMDIILFGDSLSNNLIHTLDEDLTNSSNSNKYHFSSSLRQLVEQKLIRCKNLTEGFHSTVYSTVFFLTSLTLIKLLTRDFSTYLCETKQSMKFIIDGAITFRDGSYAYVEQAR